MNARTGALAFVGIDGVFRTSAGRRAPSAMRGTPPTSPEPSTPATTKAAPSRMASTPIPPACTR